MYDEGCVRCFVCAFVSCRVDPLLTGDWQVLSGIVVCNAIVLEGESLNICMLVRGMFWLCTRPVMFRDR